MECALHKAIKKAHLSTERMQINEPRLYKTCESINPAASCARAIFKAESRGQVAHIVYRYTTTAATQRGKWACLFNGRSYLVRTNAPD